MEDRAEMAGNLKAELLDVREGLRMGDVTQAEAIKRVLAVRERRLAAGQLEPQQRRFFENAAKGQHLKLEMSQRFPVGVNPIIRAADTGREI